MKKQDEMILNADSRLEALLISAVTERRLERVGIDHRTKLHDYLTFEDKAYQVIAETVDGYFLCEEADEAA